MSSCNEFDLLHVFFFGLFIFMTVTTFNKIKVPKALK